MPRFARGMRSSLTRDQQATRIRTRYAQTQGTSTRHAEASISPSPLKVQGAQGTYHCGVRGRGCPPAKPTGQAYRPSLADAAVLAGVRGRRLFRNELNDLFLGQPDPSPRNLNQVYAILLIDMFRHVETLGRTIKVEVAFGFHIPPSSACGLTSETGGNALRAQEVQGRRAGTVGNGLTAGFRHRINAVEQEIPGGITWGICPSDASISESGTAPYHAVPNRSCTQT
jgi:hypothetical protein